MNVFSVGGEGDTENTRPCRVLLASGRAADRRGAGGGARQHRQPATGRTRLKGVAPLRASPPSPAAAPPTPSTPPTSASARRRPRRRRLSSRRRPRSRTTFPRRTCPQLSTVDRCNAPDRQEGVATRAAPTPPARGRAHASTG